MADLFSLLDLNMRLVAHYCVLGYPVDRRLEEHDDRCLHMVIVTGVYRFCKAANVRRCHAEYRLRSSVTCMWWSSGLGEYVVDLVVIRETIDLSLRQRCEGCAFHLT